MPPNHPLMAVCADSQRKRNTDRRRYDGRKRCLAINCAMTELSLDEWRSALGAGGKGAKRDAYLCGNRFVGESGPNEAYRETVNRCDVALLCRGQDDTVGLRRRRRRCLVMIVAVRVAVIVAVRHNWIFRRSWRFERMMHPVRRRSGEEKQQGEGADQASGPRVGGNISAGFHLSRKILLSAPPNRNGGASGVRIRAPAPDRKRSSLACRFSTLTRTLVPQ